jgi:hypothetical protein
MKKRRLVLIVSALALAYAAHAQPGHTGGPRFTGSTAKLFGDNQAFSADMETQVAAGSDQTMTMPGKLAFDGGKSRFDMDMGAAKGGQMSPERADQMKAMGMDKLTTISRPDKKVVYLIYTGLSAYAETALQDPEASKPASAFKMDKTELGKETVSGHACVKNKVVVTDDQGNKHESTVWNATDLKDFPVKIETTEQGSHAMTTLFTNIKLGKPDAAVFDPPSDFKKYDSPQALMQQEMMKRMGGMNLPPGHP